MRSYLFGRMPDGGAVHAFGLRDTSGLTATILQYGGRIAFLEVGGAGGGRNVTLGFDTLEPYLADQAHLGAITGRYANRIARGRFVLDGREARLKVNNGANTLHGGPEGFARRVWGAEPDGEALLLTLRSPDGDQGFPGRLDVQVRYQLNASALIIDYHATCEAPTVVNLTNHAYFNLAGAGSVVDHVLTIPAAHFTAVDAELIPTGELRAVADTALDFRTPMRIGERIDAHDEQLALAGGYDHCFVLADAPRPSPELAALVELDGLRMSVLSTEPSVQLYTGNFLSGAPFGRRTGLCLETQHLADSPNRPTFPTTVLRPGERFASRTVYQFTAL